MYRWTWQATAHGVTKSWIRAKGTHTCIPQQWELSGPMSDYMMPFKTFKYSQEKWHRLWKLWFINKGNIIALQEEVGLQNQEEENQGKKSGSIFPGLLLRAENSGEFQNTHSTYSFLLRWTCTGPAAPQPHLRSLAPRLLLPWTGPTAPTSSR